MPARRRICRNISPSLHRAADAAGAGCRYAWFGYGQCSVVSSWPAPCAAALGLRDGSIAQRPDKRRTIAAAAERLCRIFLSAGGKCRRDLSHEARHLILHLGVRLEADVEIEDHLLEACGLHLLQSVDDPC